MYLLKDGQVMMLVHKSKDELVIMDIPPPHLKKKEMHGSIYSVEPKNGLGLLSRRGLEFMTCVR